MARFQDPLWQKVFCVWLNPVCRLLHGKGIEILVLGLALLGLILIFLGEYMSGLLIALIVVLFRFINKNLLFRSMYPVYTANRKYNNSVLITEGCNPPILQLNGGTPFANGYDYGTILAEEIIYLIKKITMFVPFKAPARLLKSVNKQLPRCIYDELRGMYQALQDSHPGVVSYWNLLELQMIPELQKIGCTFVATKDSEGRITFGRNMDWMPFSSAQYTIIVKYANHNYKSLTFPGLIGCVTAWRKDLFLAMNVVGMNDKLNEDLLPSMLMNKLIMIKGRTFNDAARLAAQLKPMAPYHLSLCNENDAHCYSYYQGPNKSTYVRKMSEEGNLVVLNWTYPNNDQGRNASRYRDDFIRSLTSYGLRWVVEVLKGCQSCITTHSMVGQFEKKYPCMIIGYDNGYASDKYYPKYPNGGMCDSELNRDYIRN